MRITLAAHGRYQNPQRLDNVQTQKTSEASRLALISESQKSKTEIKKAQGNNLGLFSLRTSLNVYGISNLTKVFDLVKVHITVHIIGFGINRLELFQVLRHSRYATE